ncbi:MAG: DUF5132 domain-containing protein [Cyanobacteriota bacterium]|nr:DUF5132 domain-containing protein [Cyanobacteriota bacterium]
MLHVLRNVRPTTITTAVVGVGALAVAPVVLPRVKSLAKTTVKGGTKLYFKGQNTLENVKEGFQNAVTEAKAEMENQ